jgi:hypothetical protein
MSNQIFENYDEAHKYSLTVPWKLETCNVGESCWCRIIVPIEPIKYVNKIGDTERIDEIDYIIPDGSIDKETAEYFLELHHDKLKENKRVIKSQSFPIPTHIQDAMAKAIREASKE